MDGLTFEGNFCDIAMCAEMPGGLFCEDGACSQKKVWERLKAYEDAEVNGLLVVQCKDCKHYLKDGNWCVIHSHFDKHMEEWNAFGDNDFCSYGERRADDVC